MDNYISEVLGTLRDSGFEFKYPQGWGNWPESYLQSVITHSKAKMALMEKWSLQASGASYDPFIGFSTAEREEKQEQAEEFMKGMFG